MDKEVDRQVDGLLHAKRRTVDLGYDCALSMRRHGGYAAKGDGFLLKWFPRTHRINLQNHLSEDTPWWLHKIQKNQAHRFILRGKKTIASLEESIQQAEMNPISQAVGGSCCGCGGCTLT